MKIFVVLGFRWDWNVEHFAFCCILRLSHPKWERKAKYCKGRSRANELWTISQVGPMFHDEASWKTPDCDQREILSRFSDLDGICSKHVKLIHARTNGKTFFRLYFWSPKTSCSGIFLEGFKQLGHLFSSNVYFMPPLFLCAVSIFEYPSSWIISNWTTWRPDHSS